LKKGEVHVPPSSYCGAALGIYPKFISVLSKTQRFWLNFLRNQRSWKRDKNCNLYSVCVPVLITLNVIFVLEQIQFLSVSVHSEHYCKENNTSEGLRTTDGSDGSGWSGFINIQNPLKICCHCDFICSAFFKNIFL